MQDLTPFVRLWVPPALLLLGACLAYMTIDHATVAYFSAQPAGGVLREFFEAAEQFGTPFGQLLLLAVLGSLGWGARRSARSVAAWDWRMVRIFVTATLAGTSANLGKLLIARTRPRAFDFSLSLAEGFQGLLPMGSGGNGCQSFPSAHTASAFGFAVALSWAWPQQRSLFVLLAALVGLQRILAGAHFPSDVLSGAALGYFVAVLYIHNDWVHRCWDRLEYWCFGPPPDQPAG